MNNKTYTPKTKKLLIFVAFLSFFILSESVYLYSSKSIDEKILDKKLTFLKYSTLPDLAISTEASFVRHRSLNTVFSTYKDDGALREYFPSSFTYSNSMN